MARRNAVGSIQVSDSGDCEYPSHRRDARGRLRLEGRRGTKTGRARCWFMEPGHMGPGHHDSSPACWLILREEQSVYSRLSG